MAWPTTPLVEGFETKGVFGSNYDFAHGVFAMLPATPTVPPYIGGGTTGTSTPPPVTQQLFPRGK